MKNWTSIVAVVSVLVVAGTLYHRANKKAQMNSQTQSADINFAPAQTRLSDTNEHLDVENSKKVPPPTLTKKEASDKLPARLGQDAIGKTAAAIVKASLLRKQRQITDNLEFDCLTQTQCPIALSEFYSKGLQRLPIGELANMKALLQENMLLSELPKQEKIDFLVAELNALELQQLPPSSHRTPEGKSVVGDDVQYLLATQNRLFQLQPSPDVVIPAALTAISNTQDIVGRILLSGSLLLHYQNNPAQQNNIYTELEQMGISRQMLNDLAAAYKKK